MSVEDKEYPAKITAENLGHLKDASEVTRIDFRQGKLMTHGTPGSEPDFEFYTVFFKTPEDRQKLFAEYRSLAKERNVSIKHDRFE